MPHVPQMMRAAAIGRFGGPEELQVRLLPVPAIGPDEVLISVHVAGVGSWDADMRAGWWPYGKPRFPIVLGTDGSGIVVAVGSRVRNLKVNDKVFSYDFESPARGGFYAEFVAVPAKHVARRRWPVDLRRVGAIGATGLTAVQGILNVLRVRKKENLVILGASGGVGTLALQFARWRGARVLAIASGADGVKLARRQGAAAAVDGRRASIKYALRRFAPDGVDAVLALIGGKPLNQCLAALRSGGRCAYPNGVEPVPKKRKGIGIIAFDAVPGVAELERLNRSVKAAKLKVPIAAEYSLAEAAEAHRLVATGHAVGKIVIRIR